MISMMVTVLVVVIIVVIFVVPVTVLLTCLSEVVSGGFGVESIIFWLVFLSGLAGWHIVPATFVLRIVLVVFVIERIVLAAVVFTILVGVMLKLLRTTPEVSISVVSTMGLRHRPTKLWGRPN